MAAAGAIGAVTISTNMAGRGTDIRLGGESEADHARVAALGGLYVIGTNRHESERVDLQLRGRAGRQGDPGESRFFVSLEDDLLVRYGIHGLIPAGYIPPISDAPIESRVVTREVARAQRIVDGQNFEIRRTLARYAAVVEEQHRQLIERRQAILEGDGSPGRLGAGAGAPCGARRGRGRAGRGRRRAGGHARLHRPRVARPPRALCRRARRHPPRAPGRPGSADPLYERSDKSVRADRRCDRRGRARRARQRVASSVANWISAAPGSRRRRRRGRISSTTTRSRTGSGRCLTGPGGATVAIYAAAMMMPLLVLWGLVESFLRREPRRRQNPFGK